MAPHLNRVIVWCVVLLQCTVISNSSSEPPNAGSSSPSNWPDEEDCETVVSRWSDKNLAEVTELWDLNATDQANLRQLGNSISDVDHWKNDPFEVIRFLIQFDMNLEYCERLVRETVEWRVKNDIDTFVERYQQPSEVYNYVPFMLIRGLDRDNDPILVQRLGRLDVWGIYKQEGVDAMLDANLFLTELVGTRGNGIPKHFDWQRNYYEPLVGHRFKYFTSVIDLEGLSARQLRPSLLSLLKQSATIGQYHYPGLAKRAFVIRAPKMFRRVWSVVKHFYDKQTLKKLIFVTEDNYLDVLKEYMDLEHLPSIINPIHGKGQPMPGYYENVHLEGGLPPGSTTQA